MTTAVCESPVHTTRLALCGADWNTSVIEDMVAVGDSVGEPRWAQ
jgi:hypothetical protein